MPSNQSQDTAPSRERTQNFLLLAWLVTMVIFSIPPLVNLCTPGYEQKDYDIWYQTGRIVMNGGDIYQRGAAVYFPFMYPPPAATVLAPLTVFGKFTFFVLLVLINSAAWITCVALSVFLVTGKIHRQHTLLYVVPIIGCGAYVWDTYLLGQPNIVLLACMLGAFVCLRKKWEWGAGALIAFAAACKAFPVMAIGYLIYRRHWKATFSMVASLAFFLVLFPAPIRGFQRNLDDLVTWTNGMVLKYDTGTIAQRPEIAYHWKNQSLIATANRMLRPVEVDWIKVKGENRVVPLYVNVANLDFRVINCVIVVSALSLCLFYIGTMPRFRDRTDQSDTIEYAMLLILITIFSPLSWFYYGVWLILPFTIVTNFLLNAPRASRAHTTALVWMGVCLFLLNFVLPLPWIRPIRGIGITFLGCVSFLGLLGWMQWHTRFTTAALPAAVHTEPETLRWLPVEAAPAAPQKAVA